MNKSMTLRFLFSLLLANNASLIADQGINWWSYLNPFNLCKKIKNATVSYGAGQQALEQVKAQQQIIELLAKNPQNGACAEQLEQIVAVNKEANDILQAAVDTGKGAALMVAMYSALQSAALIHNSSYRFYKWMWPSEEEIDTKEMLRERNRDELKIYISRDASACLKNNSPEMVNRCNRVFTSYKRLFGANALADLKKSVNNQETQKAI